MHLSTQKAKLSRYERPCFVVLNAVFCKVKDICLGNIQKHLTFSLFKSLIYAKPEAIRY